MSRVRRGSTRRDFLRAGGAGAAWLGLSPLARAARAATAKPERAPSFVFLMADDMGYGDLGCFGHPVIKTPVLDAMAKDGLKLTTCYAAAANCSPSRAGFLTGRHPYRAGIYDHIPRGNPMTLRREELSLATHLKRHGYDTAFTGKWHLAGELPSADPTQTHPGDHGFDHWLATRGTGLFNPTSYVRNGKRIGRQRGAPAKLVTDEATSWIAERKDDRPFCLFVWFNEPHIPVQPPGRYYSRYEEFPNKKAAYYGTVTYLDFCVGRILGALSERGRDRDTCVFFTSDNGPTAKTASSPGLLRGKKGRTYEGGIRVPGIVRWPDVIPTPGIEKTPISSLDLFPTVCDAAGIPLPERELDGQS